MKHLVLAAGLLAGTLGAFAQTPSPGQAKPERPMRHGMDTTRLDLNADGFISREEAKAHPRLERGFARIDGNGDGKLSADEMTQFRARRMEQMQRHTQEQAKGKSEGQAARPGGPGGRYSRMDADGDGFITRDEAAGRPVLQKRFDEIDTNKDQRLSREELRAARRQHRDPKA
jgi:hypothetical protein